MFDAKSILEQIVRGAAPPNQSPQQGGGGLGGLGDILGQVLGGGQQGRGAPTGGANSGGAGGGGLSDIWAEVQRQLEQAGQQSGQPSSRPIDNTTPSPRSATQAPQPDRDAGGGLGGLGDILGQLKDKLGQPGGISNGGSIADILGQVLSQATAGAKEGATRIGDATGARDALGRATGGQTAEELLEKLKGYVRDNPMAATGAAAGAGGVLLGTKAGRAVAGSAVRIGALALIGGLAYKAFQNYQSGKPLITGLVPTEAAPPGSGFEPAAVTNETAALYIRAMIAAAAADGRVDDTEQAKIMSGLRQAGVDSEAEEFLASELNNPASVQDLANAVTSPEEAVQVYTAARIAIDPDQRGEQTFLSNLAAALGVDSKLAAHIDATARNAA